MSRLLQSGPYSCFHLHRSVTQTTWQRYRSFNLCMIYKPMDKHRMKLDFPTQTQKLLGKKIYKFTFSDLCEVCFSIRVNVSNWHNAIYIDVCFLNHALINTHWFIQWNIVNERQLIKIKVTAATASSTSTGFKLAIVEMEKNYCKSMRIFFNHLSQSLHSI